MDTYRISLLFFVAICFVELCTLSNAASTHIRTQQQNKHRAGSKERTEDGAFSPRDSGHYVDGEHHHDFDHEAILGSVKEAEEYDKLPVEESKRRLGILLTGIDLNGDKHIDKNELKAWILRSFNLLSDEESRDRLEDADADGDGKLTWDEIVQDTYGSDPEDLAYEEEILKTDKVTFEVADENNDSYLDQAEFKAFTHPEETPRMMPLVLKQGFDEYDKDKDQFISFQEYLGKRAGSIDKGSLITEKYKFDQDYDKNGDGKLDMNEVQAWLIPSNEEIAEDEVNHLFAVSDDDSDDRLTFEEVLDHHDAFVGSEATDYGDQLQNIERFQDEL